MTTDRIVETTGTQTRTIIDGKAYLTPLRTEVKVTADGVLYLSGTCLDDYQIEAVPFDRDPADSPNAATIRHGMGGKDPQFLGYILRGPKGAEYALARNIHGPLFPMNFKSRRSARCTVRNVRWFGDLHGVLMPLAYEGVCSAEDAQLNAQG